MRSTPTAGDSAADITNFLADFKQKSRIAAMTAVYEWPVVPSGPYYSNLEISEVGYGSAPRAKYARRQPSYDDSKSSVSTSSSGTEEESLYSLSTAPSRTGPELPNRGRPMPPILEWQSRPTTGHESSQTRRIPCEFHWYSMCEVHFGLEDDDEWVRHVVSQHLGSTLPSYMVCWFCDHDFQAASEEHEALVTNYGIRARHIADHIRDGGTVTDIRPDFFLLDHLRDNGLISEELFQLAREYHEAPQPRQGISTMPCRRDHEGDVVMEVGVSGRRSRRRNMH